MAGLIGLFFWSPWERPTELDWLRSYETWSEGIEAALADGDAVSRASCESTFRNEVGDPPADRLERAAVAARAGCAALSPNGWHSAQSDVVRVLVDVHSEQAPPRHQRGFSDIAGSITDVRARVYCWREEQWTPFGEQYAALRGDEEIWLKGFADTTRNRIDLEPGVCAALRRYVRRIRPPELSYENFALAEALVVLAHEAEHLNSPSASEAEVECYAIQHVRPLIRAAGWGPYYQTEIPLHAWEIAYTQLPPQYRTPACRNGGPLALHPRSDLWP